MEDRSHGFMVILVGEKDMEMLMLSGMCSSYWNFYGKR